MRLPPLTPAASHCAMSVPRDATSVPLSISTWNPPRTAAARRGPSPATEKKASGGPGGGNEHPVAGTDAAKSRQEVRHTVAWLRHPAQADSTSDSSAASPSLAPPPFAEGPGVLRACPAGRSAAQEDRLGGHGALPGARDVGHAQARDHVGGGPGAGRLTRRGWRVAGGQASGGPGGACGPEAWGDGRAGLGPIRPDRPTPWPTGDEIADGRSRGIAPGREEQPGCPVRRRRASSQGRGRDSGCIPGTDMAQCDAAGVNGSNRIMSHGAPPRRVMPNGCLGSPGLVWPWS